MNPQELLAQLAPLRTPPAIGWWPLAPGWWVLIALVTFALLGMVWLLWQRHAKNRYRRQALATLKALEDEGADTAALNRLIKVLALQVYGSESAALSGDAWIGFLVNRCDGVENDELAPLAQVYGPTTPLISPSLADAAARWIQRHEAPHV